MNTLAGTDPSAMSATHLQLSVQKINRILHSAVAHQQRIAAALERHDVTPLCVSDEQVVQLLQQVNSELCFLPQKYSVSASSSEERELQDQLREAAHRRGLTLPLDDMVRELKLSEFEKDALLVCLAPELHRSYGRIFAYIHDDLGCQAPTIGLLCSLLAGTEAEWLQHRRTLSIHGRLRRLGLLLTKGDVHSELLLICCAASGVLERLQSPGGTGQDSASSWRDQFYDPDDVCLDHVDVRGFPEGRQLKQASDALRQGQLNLLAIWGEPVASVEAAVQAVAEDCGIPLRRLPLQSSAVRDALAQASYLEAMVWIDADRFVDNENRQLAADVLKHLLPTSLPLVLSGQHAWRPTALLARRNYCEIRLAQPDEELRTQNWQQSIPELSEERARSLAQRFRLTPQALMAVKRAAGLQSQLKSSGTPCSLVDQLDDVCRFVTQTKGSRFSKPIMPRRRPDDLVLPAALHNQVLEIASFYQALTQVNEHWGFGRLSTASGGIKALFAGDSGTGKSLAAEVVASQIGLPLLKIDLSQVVSKWVGETEKNIDDAFCEAEASHAMLFFDEADTLFGKRGEIQRGADRYANLEVGYLLQRLDLFSGLVILASNLRDEIDDAFMRRFQVILYFPRPHEQERLRLWKMAFPPSAPLDDGIDVTSLVHLDMTGAGIFNASHMAGLLAANEGSAVIRHDHIVEGITRQFQRELRIIGPTELNRFCSQSRFPIKLANVR